MDCPICFEPKELKARCDRCAMRTCADCHFRLLGLCAICDREVISTPIRCYICSKYYPIFEIESMESDILYVCKHCSWNSSDSDSTYVPSDECDDDL